MTKCTADTRRTKDDWLQVAYSEFDRKLNNDGFECDPRLDGTNLNATSHVLASFGFLSDINREKIVDQFFATTATGICLEQIALDRCGLTRILASTASGTVIISGTPASSLLAGTVFTHSNGVEYYALADTDIDSTGQGFVSVQSVDVGANTNLSGGETLQIDATFSGINSTASVSSDGIAGGGDTEEDEELRGRLTACLRVRSGCGTEADYERWVRSCGADRVKIHRNGGVIKIYFTMTNRYPEDWGIPLPEDAQIIQEKIFGSNGLAPLGAFCGLICTPRIKLVDFVIDGLEPNTLTVRNNVIASIKQWFVDRAKISGRVCLSDLDAYISASAGECCHTLLAPNQNLVCGEDELPIPGKITFIGAGC